MEKEIKQRVEGTKSKDYPYVISKSYDEEVDLKDLIEKMLSHFDSDETLIIHFSISTE